jgi:heme/copper-type cytochrome/quinol oxidase subunit 4
VFGSGKTKFALHLFHAAAVILISVGDWWWRGRLRLSIIRTVNIAVHGVLVSRLRARRFVGDSRRNRCNRLTRSLPRSISRSIASLLSFTWAFKRKAESAVWFWVWVSLAFNWWIVLARTTSTAASLGSLGFCGALPFSAVVVFTGPLKFTLASLLALSFLFLSLFTLPILLLSLFSVEAEKRCSSTKTSRCDFGSTRKAVVAFFLVVALALAAAVMPVAVVLSWAITVAAVTVIVLIAAMVFFVLRIRRIWTITFRILRVKRRKSRVPGWARLKALVAPPSTVAVLAVASNAKASPWDAAVLGVPGRAQFALVMSGLTTVIIIVIVALGRAILMNRQVPASFGRALSRRNVVRVPAVSVSPTGLVTVASSSWGRVRDWVARAVATS